MSTDDGFLGFLRSIAIVILGLSLGASIGQCDSIEKKTLCAENFERHAPTAADSLRFVRSGCSVPLAGDQP